MSTYQGVQVDEQAKLCILCDREFSSIANLHRHVARKHTKSNVECQCNKCGKAFASRSALSGHMSVHNTSLHSNGEYVEADYVCEICNRHFTSLRGIKSHRMYHDDAYREWRRQKHIGRKVSDATRALMADKVRERMCNPEFAAKLKAVHNTHETRMKHSKAMKTLFANASDEYKAWRANITIQNAMKSVHDTPYGKRSVHTSKNGNTIKCDSSWEAWLCKLMDADNNVLTYDKVHEPVDYVWQGRVHKYFPDFIVKAKDGIHIVEVKADNHANDDVVLAKAKAAIQHYAKLGMTYKIMQYNDLKQYELLLQGGDAK